MNRDFSDILLALSEAGAEYLVVGAHALAAHGLPRATGDLDIWVRSDAGNAERVWRALDRFGAPLDQLTREDLTRPDVVFQIGVPPLRIDILTSISGVQFSDAWPSRIHVALASQSVPVIGREHLLANKRAAGRPQDLADVARLEAQASPS